MALTAAQILSHIGITPAARRNAIAADFLSEGLEGLLQMTSEDVDQACNTYAKRDDGAFPANLTPLQRLRLKGLVLWTKDYNRVGETLQFPNNMTLGELRTALSLANDRERRRKVQKKTGEQYLDSDFNNKLKGASQWDKWKEELETTLSQIIGSHGIPLSYIIREDEAPNFRNDVEYETAVIQGVALQGREYIQDAEIVHKIILQNITADSDAYTYVKRLIRNRNGRRSWLALRERYSGDAARQTVINQAKKSLQNLRYKNERSFTFEKFSAKLQAAYDELEENNRGEHNGNIVDDLWERIQAPELQIYVSSLKVMYQQNPRDYKEILQDIAAEASKMATKKHVSFAANVSATYTKAGKCPTSGVHTSDGSIYIGNYDSDKWSSESVRKHHKEIFEARSKDGGGKGNGGDYQSRKLKRTVNAIKRKQKKLKSLNTELDAAKVAKAKVVGNGTERKSERSEAGTNAGDEFGGRRSMANA